ncbi:MAG TPA: hypothetical protein VHH09_09040 [Acidimicrobiales bacterium]|nr:hypothetical protein [Acidimicrobiales bacterium]
MAAVDEDRLQRMTALLRELRGRLTQEPPLPSDQWELQLYAYDEALVTTADLLDVPVPQAARDEMGPDDRAAIEQALVDAGLDLGPS